MKEGRLEIGWDSKSSAVHRPGIRSLIVLLILSFLLVSCSSETSRPPLRLGAPISTQAALVWLTRDLGLFRKKGVGVELRSYASGKRALQELLAGDVDMAIVAETPFVIAAFDHPDLRLLATLGKSDNEVRILARRDHGIEKPSDLAGKTIATQRGSAVHFFLSSFLLRHRLEPSRVEVRFLRAERLADALVSGTVDAISMRDPFLEKAKKRLGKGTWVEMSDPGLYTKTYNLVAREDLVRKRPEAVEKVLEALVEASDYLHHHPRRARVSMARELGLPIRRLEQLWPSLQFRVSLNQGLLVTLQEEAEWALDSGLAGGKGNRETPDFLALLDLGPLSRVAPDAVGVIGMETSE